MDGSWWQLLLERPNDVYTRDYLYVGDMFFYNHTFSLYTLLYGRYNLYRLDRKENGTITWDLDKENILWPWRRKWQPTPAFLSGESHEQRCLEGYNP